MRIGRNENGEDIRAYSGELTKQENERFKNLKKMLSAANKHRGEKVSFVIVEANDSFNGAERRGDTIYIAKDTLERDAATARLTEAIGNGNYAGTFFHEYGHTLEGTEEQEKLFDLLAEDDEIYKAARDRVYRDYGITEQTVSALARKQARGEALTKNEQSAMRVLSSELSSTLEEYVLGNERAVHKLVMEDASLAEKVVDKLIAAKNRLTGKTDGYSRAERKRIDKALKLYLKATESAGENARRLRQTILSYIEKEEEEAKKENSTDKTTRGSNAAENGGKESANNHKSENMSVSGENIDSVEEIRYSKKNSLSLAQNVDLVLKMSNEEALDSKEKGDFISIMQTTPSVVTENVKDAESLEIIMRFDAFYLATRKQGVLEGHYHNYGETMKRLPEIISNPLAIVRMNNKRLNLLAVVPHDKGDNNIISLELNTVKDINSKYDKYNLLITVTPAKDNYVRNNLFANGIKVEYKKEDLSQVNHQLYEWLAIVNDRSSNISIPDFSEKVNSEVKYSRKSGGEDIDSESDLRYNEKNDTSGGEDGRRKEEQRKGETPVSLRSGNNSRESMSLADRKYGKSGRDTKSDRRGRSGNETQEPLPEYVRNNADSIYSFPKNSDQKYIQKIATMEDEYIRFVKWRQGNDCLYWLGESTIYIRENLTIDEFLELLTQIKPIKYNLDPNKIAHISNERWDRFLNEYPDSYITTIPIQQFLDMTTVNSADKRGIYSESRNISKQYPLENIKKTTDDYMYLKIDFDEMRVIDHNGRHRMTAMLNEGIAYVDVFVIPKNDYTTDYHENLQIKGQFNDNAHNITILRANSELFTKTIKKLFRTDDGNFRYSRKAPTDTVTISKGEMQKRKANFESDKVYSRSEVERALKKIDGINHLPSKMRTEIFSDVWNAFNSRYSSEQRGRHIDILGNRIIATVLQNAQSDEVKAKKQKLYRERNRLNKKAKKSNTDQKRLAEIDTELEALDYFISIRKSHRGAPDGIIF